MKKRAAQVAEVTAKRVMPPWPPESDGRMFEGERRLTEEELGVLQQWITEGAIEGNPSDLPSAPLWPEDWFLGEPDLVVKMPRPYTLPAEGRDLYRNFVIAIPTNARRFVRAVELRPGNSRVVHHGFMFLDETGQSRRLDGKEAQPGPPAGARMPEGQFLSYQPGRQAAVAPQGLAWVLEKGSHLLLQLHLKPTGKAETLQASVGFYFTDRAPTNVPFKAGLTSLTIEIPPGVSNYMVKDSFELPVDAKLIGVLPHAHYLAREMKAFAALPDGTTASLIHIKNWDFNWQGDYRYAEPVFLPRGSIVNMEYTYDNSANNVRNPNQPPKPVSYGEQSSDEMGELWLQLLVSDAADRAALFRAYALKNDRVHFERSEFLLKKNPRDPKGNFTRALVLLNQKRTAEALRHFKLALEAKPDYQEAHFTLGVVHLMNRNLHGAEEAFKNAIRLDPEDFRSQGSLGNVFLGQGRIDEAAAQFQTALRLNPNDTTAKENLEMIRRRAGKKTSEQR
ncbi:MAG: tetratricopeptide repeat protein [Verrucomicrobia bacterium]|nr:tetratricopeptide repeat protein [Verrucomicrobiota bacterium]